VSPEIAHKILHITLGDSVVQEPLYKSFFDFDLRTPEGITSFLTVLPVSSDELVMQAVQEVWPGCPTENFDLVRARLELRGYLLDYLIDLDSNNNMIVDEEEENEVTTSE
jgi:hypothetical protein